MNVPWLVLTAPLSSWKTVAANFPLMFLLSCLMFSLHSDTVLHIFKNGRILVKLNDLRRSITQRHCPRPQLYSVVCLCYVLLLYCFFFFLFLLSLVSLSWAPRFAALNGD